MPIEVGVSRSRRRYRLTTTIPAKGLYRRALARVALKEEAEAEKDLAEATKLVNDQAISSELEKVRARRKANMEREKAKFKKMFA
jgi:peptidyl-prolyl isomerase D